LRCGSAATNLAAAARKILITVAAIGFLVIIKVSLIHEVDQLDSLLGELGLVSANILAESNAMLLEEVMIIQGTVGQFSKRCRPWHTMQFCP